MSAPVIIVMGVCGTGKSAVGQGVARGLGVPFLEGDSFHPPKNVEKMGAGVPLTDEDRGPWLRCMADALKARSEGGAVLACSALRRSYRDVLRAAGECRLVHLDGDRALIAGRMAERRGHYMPVSLLDSQIAVLEPPGDDERALRIDIGQPVHRIIATVLDWIERESPG